MLASALAFLLLLNLGIHGPTYTIEEPDMLEEIHRQAQAPELKEEFTRKLRESYQVNLYLPDVKQKAKRTLRFTYTAPESLVIDGREIVKAGQSFNVLEKVRLRTKYLFLKDYQMPLFEKLAKKDPHVAAVIIQGDLLPLVEKHEGKRVYMGNSRLIEKFGLTGVPSLVYQEREQIVVEEIPYITKH